MKHAITLTTLLMVSSDLFAGFRNVNELDSCLVTVQAVKSMEAHSVVALEGRLVRQIDDDELRSVWVIMLGTVSILRQTIVSALKGLLIKVLSCPPRSMCIKFEKFNNATVLPRH